MNGAASLRAWWLAIRPTTLAAGAAPVLVGLALAARDGHLRLDLALATLLGALLIQIGTNLANDADDFARGADTAQRRGPVRVTQAGLLTASDVRRAAFATFGLAALDGLYLISCAGWPIAALGTASIAAGLAYTGGPWPLGYHGLGDVFVFLFFGVAAVVGTYYVQTGACSAASLAASVPLGALASAILVANNVRDRDGDRAAGKRTLVVRLGETAGRRQYAALLALAFTVPPLLWLSGAANAAVLLPLLLLPRGARLAHSVLDGLDGAALNSVLGSTARLELGFALLLSVGVLA
jgi:1,4-dihydroxy-2-naphthoate polyprenyltransferase